MTFSETQQKDLAKKTNSLLEAIAKVALEQVALEKVRADRDVAPEKVSDAARLYRESENIMKVALEELLVFQCSLLKESV